MIDYEQRTKEFLLWLEQRILQREFTHARMENGRNKDLLKAELAEAKLIRDRCRALMQAMVTADQRAGAGNRVVAGQRASTIEVESVDEILDGGTKPRVVH